MIGAVRTAPNFIHAGERSRTVDEIRMHALKAAAGLNDMGIREGETIALLLRNDFAFFEASLAANFVGAYPVPINWHATPAEAQFVLEDCGARALIVHEDLLETMASAVPADVPILRVQTPPEILAAYKLERLPAPSILGRGWDSWVEAFDPLKEPNEFGRTAVIYTSGTTGRPKGVQRLPAPPSSAPPGASAFGFDQPGPIRVLMNGPMYHSAPNVYGMAALRLGADIILQARFDAEEMLALIETHRITHMHIVPTMFVRLLKLPAFVRQRYDISSLKWVIHGAAPCPPDVKRAMIDWWGPVIYEYYGSTETGLATFSDSFDAIRKPGTVGRTLPDAVVKIFDESGREVGVGQEGEIYIRSGSLPDFTYLGLPEKRAEVGRGDLVTIGDVGKMDEDGYLFLCDRKRDMIISGGVNIYPAEIEAAILGVSGVRDCAVFGIPDEEFGESICAYIEAFPDVVMTQSMISEHLRGRISRFKIPSTIKFVRELPREDSGKIFKRKLRQPYWDRVRK